MKSNIGLEDGVLVGFGVSADYFEELKQFVADSAPKVGIAGMPILLDRFLPPGSVAKIHKVHGETRYELCRF